MNPLVETGRPVVPASIDGTRLGGRYRLERLMARGGMGDVFEAEDERLRRRVAVKVFRSGPASDRQRFDREATLLASLDHPGLVRVFDAGEHAGEAYVVLELVEGPDLASQMSSEGRVPPDQVATLGIAIADALAYVHERGVVHRDVTPSNILCGADGRPRLADFGIARLVDTRRTASTTAIGTAAYMAPEQVQGHEVTPAADVYSLGLVLLELLTGRPGFAGSSHEVAVARLVRSPDTTTDVPEPWRDLLADMTDRAPGNRPSASAVRERLAAISAATAPTTLLARPVDPTAAGGGAVDATTVLASGSGQTEVLPALLAPEPPGASPVAVAVGTMAGRIWSHRWLLAGLALLALVLLAGLAFGGGSGVGAPPPETTPSTAPVATTAPPTTAPPPPTTEATAGGEQKGEGRKDEGRGAEGKGPKKDDG